MANAKSLEPNTTYIPLIRVEVLRWVTRKHLNLVHILKNHIVKIPSNTGKCSISN